MKAKTIDNSPYGWCTCVYDNEDCPMGYYVDDLPDKERADKYTNIFNLELSSHVAKETEKLQAEIKELKAEVERLEVIKWINVEERLPECDGIFLVCTIAGDVDMIEFNNGAFGVEHQNIFIPARQGLITHWQPLPQPTK